jgi:hypothetical protein
MSSRETEMQTLSLAASRACAICRSSGRNDLQYHSRRALALGIGKTGARKCPGPELGYTAAYPPVDSNSSAVSDTGIGTHRFTSRPKRAHARKSYMRLRFAEQGPTFGSSTRRLRLCRRRDSAICQGRSRFSRSSSKATASRKDRALGIGSSASGRRPVSTPK